MLFHFMRIPETEYVLEEELGRGAYGVVYQGYHALRKEIVAIKVYFTETENHGIASTTLRQIALLNDLSQNKHVVRLKETLLKKQQIYLIFEYFPKDLKKYLRSLGEARMERKEIKSFLHQMLLGIADCHVKMVIHRDLKPENILLDEENVIKIADFGLARTISSNKFAEYTEEVVTLWYRAPELLVGRKYGAPVDIWSIACIFAEMARGEPLFQGTDEKDQLCKIFCLVGAPTKENWPEIQKLSWFQNLQPTEYPSVLDSFSQNELGLDERGVDLLQKMLVCNPHKRISAKQALKHSFFQSLKL